MSDDLLKIYMLNQFKDDIAAAPIIPLGVEIHNQSDEWRIAQLEARVSGLKQALSKQNDDVVQTLGKALGYPWFKDDQKNFPGSDETHGVCPGDHVAESIAMEAARRVKELEARVKALEEALKPFASAYVHDGLPTDSYIDITAIRHSDLARAAATVKEEV